MNLFIQVIECEFNGTHDLYLRPEKIELFYWVPSVNRDGYYLIFMVNNTKYYSSKNNDVINFKSIDEVISKLRDLGIYF